MDFYWFMLISYEAKVQNPYVGKNPTCKYIQK
jgi:hypothetical protein